MPTEAAANHGSHRDRQDSSEQRPIAAAEYDRTELDEDVISAAMRGDRAAFEIVMRSYQREMFARAYALLRNAADAEDEVQNTWTKAWARRSQFAGSGSIAAWLSRIVTNNCLMRIRQRRHLRSVSLDQTLDVEGFSRLEPIHMGPDQEKLYANLQLANLVQREIVRLPSCYRTVLLLNALDRLPVEQVAEQLGLSVPATKSRISRARVELRRRMTTQHRVMNAFAILMEERHHVSTAIVRG